MNEAEKAVANGELVTGNYTFQAALPMGKSLTVSGYIYSHNTLPEISRQMDLMADVIDRQRARAEIPELEVKLDQKFAALRNHKEHLEGLIKSRDASLQKEKLSSVQKKTMDDQQAMIANGMTTISKLQEDIDKGLAAIEEAKRKSA